MVKPSEVLTAAEVGQLLASASGQSATAKRDRAFVAVLYGGGLRIAEALALMPRDLDRAKGTLNIRKGKGHKQRLVVLDAAALAHLDLWLACRSDLGLNGRQPVFCGVSKHALGNPLATAHYRRRLPQLAAKAGIEKRVHAHGLRHSHAVGLVEDGLPLIDIRDQLGHSSAATTDVYLRRIAPQDRISRMRAIRPLDS